MANKLNKSQQRQGRRVLVTAGASGIGKAMADRFAHSGYRVAVLDTDGTALQGIPDDWLSFHGSVADEVTVKVTFTELARNWGGVDAVCVNAGIAGPTAALESIEVGDWNSCLAVNLLGAMLTTKYAAQLMKKRRSGALVYTSSTAGIYGYPYRGAYAAAKWGVIGLMKTAAMELGPSGVRANAICPGAVNGDRMQGVIAHEAKAKGMSEQAIQAGYTMGTSMRSFVDAEDIANLAFFLASSKARLLSGQVIAVDGHTENPNPKL